MCLKKGDNKCTLKKTERVGMNQLSFTINKESFTLFSLYNNVEPHLQHINAPVKVYTHDNTIFSTSSRVHPIRAPTFAAGSD